MRASAAVPRTRGDRSVSPDEAPDTPDLLETPSAAIQTERVLVRATMFFRIGGLAQIAVALTLVTSRYPSIGETVALVAGVTAESAVFIAACTRRGALHRGWVFADVVLCAAGLVTGAALTAPRDGHSWVHFMYPFTLITSIGIGLAYRRLRTVIAMTAILATAYAASAIAIHHDPAWNATPNALSYPANTIVAWAVARQFRRNGRDADTSRAQAAARADELAAERERGRHARLLHDRVLQTLETLARGDQLPAGELKTHIVTEAAWLRSLVEGTPSDHPGDLLTALQSLIEAKTTDRLRIEFNSTRLRGAGQMRADLPAHITEALVDATREAINNVAKHAGVDRATVRAAVSESRLIVSILDHGCGFDQATAHRGIGLEQSIQARMTSVGGSALIETDPGAGTYVELTVPL